MLATELNPTTTTTSTTTTTVPTSTILVTTTTTTDPGPNVSDVLRIAHDELYEFDSLTYVALTDTDITVVGQTRSTSVGRWNRSGTTTLQIGFGFDERIAALVTEDMGSDPDEVAAVIEGLSDAIFYRFPADGLAWFSRSTLPEWTGVPKEQLGDGAVDAAADALTYLDPLFEAIIEIDPAPTIDAAGNAVYQLVLDADLVVPVIAVESSANALIDAGYDGTSEATTTGTVTLDPDGALIGASVDQTPWWRAGWEAAGLGGAVGDGIPVRWTMRVTASPDQVPVEAPCADPTTEFDTDLGVDVLICG